MMKKLFSKIKFPLLWNYPSFSLGRSDHDLSIRESGTASLSKFYWIFSFSCTLPSNLISSCKNEVGVGIT